MIKLLLINIKNNIYKRQIKSILNNNNMTTDVRNLVSKNISTKSRIAINHYISIINTSENRKKFAGFSSIYISSIVAYISWVEYDSRFN